MECQWCPFFNFVVSFFVVSFSWTLILNCIAFVYRCYHLLPFHHPNQPSCNFPNTMTWCLNCVSEQEQGYNEWIRMPWKSDNILDVLWRKLQGRSLRNQQYFVYWLGKQVLFVGSQMSSHMSLEHKNQFQTETNIPSMLSLLVLSPHMKTSLVAHPRAFLPLFESSVQKHPFCLCGECLQNRHI